MKITVGDKLTLSTKTRYLNLNGMTFRVKGILHFPIPSINSRFFFLPIDTAQDLLKMSSDNSVTEIIIRVKNERKLRQTITVVNAALQEAERDELIVQSWKSISFYYAYTHFFDFAVAICALFFFLAGTIVIVVTTIMVINERIREIGTLSAMGMTGGEIVRLFFMEALFISAFSAFIGVVIGMSIALPLGVTGIAFPMEGVERHISSIIRPKVNPVMCVLVYIYSVGVASLTTFFPARRAAQIEPVNALRTL